MNKLDKLRDAVEKGDASSFIHNITDFSEEDIIGFTGEDFDEILKCCSKIKLDETKEVSKELFNFLFTEGLQAYENSKIELVKENALIQGFYFSIYLALYSKHDIYYARAASNLGLAHLKFVEIGFEPEKNLEEAIRLHQFVKKILPKDSKDYAIATMNLGLAHLRLAELGIEREKNLKESMKLSEEARTNFPKDSPSYACAVGNLGYAQLRLAELGIEREKNLKESMKLLEEVRVIFPKDRLDYAGVIMNQGLAYLEVADIGIECEKNLKESIKLQQEARSIFPKDSIYYARATMNQGVGHLMLAKLEVKPNENFKIAEELFEISRNIFLINKDGWGYPFTVFYSYTLYRSMFWKNGDKSFLRKVNDLLKESKKNIDAWQILNKNDILGMLYEVEADLCEFGEDYYNAGMKYIEAYGLTKNEYHRFMFEFCGAKSSIKKNLFCELTSRWETIDKKGIFLDFYDYAVFECHLEEASKNEAIRFDEINKAKIKLDEIYTRTPIYHIKARVNACVEILNAYLNYFPEKDEERDEKKAKENISNACRIFNSQGYKHEIDLCNMFIKAIKDKGKQEVWLDLIKNHLSDNLSKLIGEAAINEMVKSQTIGIKADLGEIKAGVKEIKTDIKELKSELKTSFVELSKKCDPKTQKLIEELSEKIIKKLEERDERWFEKLKEELIRKSPEIEKEISTLEVKSKWSRLINKLKGSTSDIPRELFIIMTAEEIRDYFVPFLSTAIGSHAAYPVLIAILSIMGVAVSKDK